MDLKKYLLPLLGFLLLGTAAPAVEFFDGRGNVTAGTINISTDKLLFSDVSAPAGSRIKNITPATLRTDLDLLTITSAAATYIASGGPASVTELTVTDFISASGKNLAIGDITLGTTITFPDNTRQTFNPGATVAGLNVGSYAGNPSTPTNGDLWYNSTATTLNARINGATVTLGAGVGDAVLGAPASFTELTATDFIEASGVNLNIGDITLGTTITFPDNTRQTFNPGTSAPGLNVGAYAGNPSTPSNGDLWYNSTANTLRARINGATVDLGAGSVDAAANYTWTGTHDFSGATLTLPTFSSITVSGALSAGSFEFEGATADAYETTLAVTDPTADRTITLPNATGTVALAQIVTKSTAANYTIGTTDSRELYGGTIYVTGAATLTIPAVAAGASFTVVTIGAVAVSVDPNASDLVVLDGTALADGDKVTNASTAGDIAVFTYYDGTGWYCASNGWTDGN